MKKIDIKKIGTPNICFSLTESNDDREKQYSQQRKDRGFDDSETWSLSDTIANFIIPRLERYLEVCGCYDDPVDEIISVLEALKLVVRDDGARIWTKEEYEKIETGLKNFADIFLVLWW